MSRGRIRRNDYYEAAVSILTEMGLSFREQAGRKHGKIYVTIGDVERLIPISGSPSDRRGILNFKAEVKRNIRTWKAEAEGLVATPASAQLPTLEKEAMDDSTMDIVLHEIDGEPRVLDTDIGANLGFERPRKIRDLILRNINEFERFGSLAPRRGKSRGQYFTEYRLNEEQALLAATLSDAPRSADVRHMLIKVFVAWRRGQIQPDSDFDRAIGMLKSLVRDLAQHRRTTDEHGRAIQAIEEALTNPTGQGLIPAFNFAGSVTALDIITMAGIKPEKRVRGTSAAVTLRMKDFCLANSFSAMQTPQAIDASSRWRFPREAAQQWLYGDHHGAEFIHSHVRARRGETTPDMFAVIKGGKR